MAAWPGTTHARRLAQLYVGLWLYGLAAALQVRSGLGLDPWDVFHQGLSKHVGLAIGTVVSSSGRSCCSPGSRCGSVPAWAR